MSAEGNDKADKGRASDKGAGRTIEQKLAFTGGVGGSDSFHYEVFLWLGLISHCIGKLKQKILIHSGKR